MKMAREKRVSNPVLLETTKVEDVYVDHVLGGGGGLYNNDPQPP